MIEKTFFIACIMLTFSQAQAQITDTTRVYDLPQVMVSDSTSPRNLYKVNVVQQLLPADIAQISASTVGELLEYLPGVDVRTRGTGGVQADLSMRGGTFDQVLVMLNGVNITDPQTGHHNLDLPINLATVERIDVIHGTPISHFGLSAFSGAINIITDCNDTTFHNRVQAGIVGGSHGYFAPMVTARLRCGRWQLTGTADHNSSSGYINNTDYKYDNFFARAVCRTARSSEWQLQIGAQLKNFGSNAFYSLKYPDQYEATKTLNASVLWCKWWQHASIDATLYTRLHADRFELFREGAVTVPTWYVGHNYHLNDVEGLQARGNWFWHIGKSSVGIEIRHEHIWSNVLGDTLAQPRCVPFEPDSIHFTVGAHRININYFAEQTLASYDNRWHATVGAAGNYNSHFGHDFTFSISGEWHFIDGGKAFVGMHRALRLPTFTDLYYHSATQQANPALKSEQSMTFEAGLQWHNAHWHNGISTFYRIGHNIIDWVKLPEEAQWQSANHTRVDGMGGELQMSYHCGYWLKKAEISYSFCHLNKTSGERLSKYALDYLRHKLSISVSHGLGGHFGADWLLTLQQRNGSFADRDGNIQRYHTVYLLSGRIYWQRGAIRIYAEAENILNRHYYDYGGIEQSGITAKTGMAVQIDKRN